MAGTDLSSFSSSNLKFSTPGFDRPMAFITPPVTSTVVGFA